MDLGSAFKSEVFRPVVTLIIPGATSLAPYVILLRIRYDPVADFWNDHTTAAFSIIGLAAIAVGLMLEAVGAQIETRWDRMLERASKRHTSDWYRYLMLAFPSEPIGQRYLRTLQLALKFELAMGVALPLMYIGVLWLSADVDILSNFGRWGWGVLVLGSAVYMLYESYETSKTLATVRMHLVNTFSLPVP